MKSVLIISGGNAEDLIGATLARQLSATVYALPLVGKGDRYQEVTQQILGPKTVWPSGGFPFNSLQNLVDDLKAGLIGDSLGQLRTAWQQGQQMDGVVAVGDAYALGVGVLASRKGQVPLFHLQPQISHHYWGGRSTWERLKQPNQFGAEDYLFYERYCHRFVQAVYVRDKLSEQRAHQLGMQRARFVGSMAMDILGPPERDLSPYRDQRPVLALLPGTRGDVSFSLPRMLESSLLLSELQGMVAWTMGWEQANLPSSWRLEPLDDQSAIAAHPAGKVWLLRKAFSAILHEAKVTIGTSGTGNEQAAGMGAPVVAFPTQGPQYIYPNALRQSRLLGRALRLVEADPNLIARHVRELLSDPQARALALQDAKERNSPPGALPKIAQEIHLALYGVTNPSPVAPLNQGRHIGSR